MSERATKGLDFRQFLKNMRWANNQRLTATITIHVGSCSHPDLSVLPSSGCRSVLPFSLLSCLRCSIGYHCTQAPHGDKKKRGF